MTVREMLPRAVMIIGLLAPALMVGGALGTKNGVWGFQTGFQFVFTGAFAAAAVLVLGLAVLVFALRAGRTAEALPIGVGLAGCVIVLAVLGWQFRLATSLPPIHDVSTDRGDPPAFSAVARLRGETANPLEYTEAVAQLQSKAYPELETMRSALSTGESFDRAVRVAEGLGWRIVNEDPGAGLVEAVDTTFWFGFDDDVVIRVRATAGGSLVDLRSASRVGESDLGANAARIEGFMRRFEESGQD